MATDATTTTALDTSATGTDVPTSTPTPESAPSTATAAPTRDTSQDSVEVAALKQTVRTMEGRLAAAERRGASPEEIRRLELGLRKVNIRLDPALTQEETDARLKDLDAEAQKAADAEAALERLQSASATQAARAGAFLKKAGLSTDHPKVKEVLERWGNAGTPDAFTALADEIIEFASEERATAAVRAAEAAKKDAAAKAEEDRIKSNRENGTLAVGASGGMAVVLKREPTIEDLMERGKNVQFMSPKERAEFAAQWNAARKRKS